MCGILGAFSTRGDLSAARFAKGLDRIRHRGPDGCGVTQFSVQAQGLINATEHVRFCGEESNVLSSACFGLLGHRRLSILDLSSAGHQPMPNASKNLLVAFNGEIYNYIELRKELSNFGYSFRSGSDTEVILAAYHHWGKACFARFNGMWAIALIDLEKQEIVLSRDRFGVKPLFVVQRDGELYFASELKALLTAGCVEPTLNLSVAHDFLVYGAQPVGGSTYFRDVSRFEAGATAIFSLVTLERYEQSRWWKIEPTVVRAEEALEAWRESFLDAVKIRMRSDVPVGSCLSGGLDSSAIVCAATAGENVAGNFNTFTSCYEDPASDERYYAEKVVERTGASPNWVYPGVETSLNDDLTDLVDAQEEPFSTLSMYSQYCVMRAAHRAGIKVLLDGQGADEVLMGYDHAQALSLALNLRRGMLRAGMLDFLSLCRAKSNLSPAALAAMVAYHGIPAARLLRNRILSRPYLSSQLKKAAESPYFSRLPIDLQSARESWLEKNPLPALLRYEDRNSMRFSVETRLPFLDYRLVNLSFGLPSNLVTQNGWTKYVIRRAMEGCAPKEVIWRRDKKGFPTPSEQFMRENAQRFAALFDDQAASGELVNAKKIRSEFLSGRIRDFNWRFVSFELWMRQFNVSI